MAEQSTQEIPQMTEEKLYDDIFGNNDTPQADNVPAGDQSENVQDQHAQKGTGLPADKAGEPKVDKTTDKPINPDDVWNQSASTAFVDDKGEIDIGKMNSFFLEGKSLFNYVPETPKAPPIQQQQQPTDLKLSPEQEEEEYRKMTEDTWLGWASRLEQLVQQTGDFGKAFEIVKGERSRDLQNYYMKMEVEKGKQLVKKELEEVMTPLNQMKKETEMLKRNTQIQENVNRVATNFEGMVKGMNGSEVLDQLVLDHKYAGKVTQMFMLKAHPEILSMPDGEEKKAIAMEFLSQVRSDPAMLGHLADFGRMKWFMSEQLPNIIKHAQKTALTNKQNTIEAKGSGISPITGGKYDKLPDKGSGDFWDDLKF